jgi:hypothetical protein
MNKNPLITSAISNGTGRRWTVFWTLNLIEVILDANKYVFVENKKKYFNFIHIWLVG